MTYSPSAQAERGFDVRRQPRPSASPFPRLRARKNAQPVVCLTCYHAHTARLLDLHVDLMLVGDSLGNVMHGLETTIPVTLDMMITAGKAVMRGSKHALVVVDMPFGTYEESPQIAFRNAVTVMKETGCPKAGEVRGRRRAHRRDRALSPDPARASR